jgi:hypothetical protein
MKQHGIIWVIAVGLALALGWMDYETTSWCVLLCNGGNAITLLIFSLKKPRGLINAEIKLESTKTNATVYLKDYSGKDVGKGFMEYKIPFTDFTGLDVSDIKIPFGIWNPQDANKVFVKGTVLLDNLHFSK